MWQYNLAFELLLYGVDTFRVIHGQGTDMGCHPRQSVGFRATHSQHCSNDCILIAIWYVGTGDDYVVEDEVRIGSERSMWRRFTLH